MAYRELIMIEVREILRRLLDEHGLRRIARETSVDRKTVTRYPLAATAAGLTRGTALTDEVVRDIARRVQARAPAAPSDEWREGGADKSPDATNAIDKFTWRSSVTRATLRAAHAETRSS